MQHACTDSQKNKISFLFNTLEEASSTENDLDEFIQGEERTLLKVWLEAKKVPRQFKQFYAE